MSHRVTVCGTCNGDGIVELPEGEHEIVMGYLAKGARHDPRTRDELSTMQPCPALCRRPGELPLDYEPCGDCGFDHGYDYESAAGWHTEHPGSYPWEVVTVQIGDVEPSFAKMYVEAVRDGAREQLVQALIQHTGNETHSRDLVARIEQRQAWLFILYPDHMHDMVGMLLSIG